MKDRKELWSKSISLASELLNNDGYVYLAQEADPVMDALEDEIKSLRNELKSVYQQMNESIGNHLKYENELLLQIENLKEKLIVNKVDIESTNDGKW